MPKGSKVNGSNVLNYSRAKTDFRRITVMFSEGQWASHHVFAFQIQMKMAKLITEVHRLFRGLGFWELIWPDYQSAVTILYPSISEGWKPIFCLTSLKQKEDSLMPCRQFKSYCAIPYFELKPPSLKHMFTRMCRINISLFRQKAFRSVKLITTQSFCEL